MGISVVFPAYNEEMNIRSAIERALAAMRDLGEAFEILIVDDCSTDSTGRIAGELAAAHPEIRVLHNPRNLGQGASLARAFEHVRYERFTHDAMDYSFDLRDLSTMLPLCEEADIVVAARTSRAGYTPYRVLTSVVHRALLHLLFPPRLSDYSFTQIYPRSVWKALQVESRCTAFLMPEALIRAHDMGYRIQEVKIAYHARLAGEATAGKPKVILQALRDMLLFWWKRLRGGTPRAYPKYRNSLQNSGQLPRNPPHTKMSG
jgi:glycosyltransferase involved in cell wall biosynthesis